MSRIEETALPGVGKRFELATESGHRIGVIRHRTGRRELYVNDAEDPDLCRASVQLDEDESNALADILGGSQLVRELESLHQDVEGLAIDWLRLEPAIPVRREDDRRRPDPNPNRGIGRGSSPRWKGVPGACSRLHARSGRHHARGGDVDGIEQVNEIIATG